MSGQQIAAEQAGWPRSDDHRALLHGALSGFWKTILPGRSDADLRIFAPGDAFGFVQPVQGQVHRIGQADVRLFSGVDGLPDDFQRPDLIPAYF